MAWRQELCRAGGGVGGGGGQEILNDDLGLEKGQNCRIGVGLKVLDRRVATFGEGKL